MDALQNTLNSVRLAVLDRVGNPLVGSFFLAWAVWNFRLLMVIFGDGPWKEKIEYIDQGLMPSRLDWLLHGYLAPLVFALIWVFCLPWVFRKVQVYHHGQLAKTAEAVMEVQDKRPIDKNISTQLLRQLREHKQATALQEARYEEDVAEMSGRIERLQQELKEARSKAAHNIAKPTDAADLDASGNNHVENEQQQGKNQSFFDPSLDQVADRDGSIALNQNGSNSWPRLLGQQDLEQLPSSIVNKIKNHRFEKNEVKALLALKLNNFGVEFLADALEIDDVFDAQIVLDQFLRLGLIGRHYSHRSGRDYDYFLNADGRILAAFFKRVFADNPID